MEILFNTSNQIDATTEMEAQARDLVGRSLGKFEKRLTRVEVHLDDENGPKGGAQDIRCTMEARPEGLRPFAVTEHAPDIDAALRSAAKALSHRLDTEFGKLDARHRGR